MYLQYLLFLDIDECATNTNNCDINATCKNTVGSFTCSCNDGFKSNGSTCIGNPNYCLRFENEFLIFTYILYSDSDECVTQTYECHRNAGCSNNIGSYSCKCNIGYYGNGPKKCEGKGL